MDAPRRTAGGGGDAAPRRHAGARNLHHDVSDDAGQIARSARVTWLAHPPHGHGRVAVGARAFTQLPISFSGEQTEEQVTTPGELLAASHASAVTMILALKLEADGTPARELIVACHYIFSSEWFEIEAISFDVKGRVDGMDAARFTAAVKEAVDRCAASLGLRGTSGSKLKAELL